MLLVWTVFIVFGLLLSSCGAGAKAITEGTLRDTIFSVEPRVNGTVSVWFTHDDVGVYCTYDKTLGDKALELLKSPSAEVIATYRSVNNTDPEYGAFLDVSKGCGDNSGKNNSTVVYKLLSITSIEVLEIRGKK
jgi:hypothetical protein